MEDEELPEIASDVDYEKIAPIDKKRMVAFFNHFLMNTVSFLNKFAQSCESRLMEFEYKLQKVEASLLIVESQLSSIPGLECDINPIPNTDSTSELKTEVLKSSENSENTQKEAPIKVEPQVELNEQSHTNVAAEENSKDTEITANNSSEGNGIKASEHPIYKKFFKMVQFGVPESAVKLKMQAEGFDPNVLQNPNQLFPPVVEEEKNSDQDSENSSD